MFRFLQISFPCFAIVLLSFAAAHAADRLEANANGASLQLRGIAPEIDVLNSGVLLFSDRNYRALEIPESLKDMSFVRGSIEGTDCVVTDAGTLTVLIPYSKHPATKYQGDALEKQGYSQLPDPDNFQLFGPNDFERVTIYQKAVTKGEKLSLRKFAVLVGVRSVTALSAPNWKENDGERLENGIVLPVVWPPNHLDPKSTEPMPVPYLEHPPKVIPINRGRQLFVDDFLIESTDLVRQFHQAEKYTENPVFRAETAEELASSSIGERGQEVVCYLGHGGVFYDPSEQLFKMFYTAGWRGGLAMATSPDLVNWTRPKLNADGTNILLKKGWDSVGGDNCLWLDLNSNDPQQRLKFLTDRGKSGHQVSTSADGRHWSDSVTVGRAGDYCSFFYNPFRNVWVYSVKRDGPRGRSRYYSESREFMKADWSDSVYWTNADKLDRPEQPGSYPHPGEAPQLYSLNAVAYESLMVGIHYIHRGPNNGLCDQGKFPKLTDLELGFSRDGFHWHRPDRSGFIRGSRVEGAWDRAYLHSTAGVFAVIGDKLVFPYTGYSGHAPSGSRGMYTGASVGLATLRRDGFASLDAIQSIGTVTTRPVTFDGKHLFVNANVLNGKLRVAAVNENGQEIAPFTFENCQPVSTDSTLQSISWKNTKDLSALHGQSVRFCFEVTNGSLYSFWVSQDESGRSDGYVAAGGPGYTGTTDTVGRDALKQSR